jgi:hypothetical protein
MGEIVRHKVTHLLEPGDGPVISHLVIPVARGNLLLAAGDKVKADQRDGEHQHQQHGNNEGISRFPGRVVFHASSFSISFVPDWSAKAAFFPMLPQF